MSGYLYPFEKKEYVKDKRRKVDCIICSIANKEKDVVCLDVARTEYVEISVNLYPYNSGHVMVYPIRHVVDVRELTADEDRDLANATKLVIDMLDEIYSPAGYNIGYNQGDHAGASINHIHQHIVPRFSAELGVIQVIGGAKIMIENPVETQKILVSKLVEKSKKYPELKFK